MRVETCSPATTLYVLYLLCFDTFCPLYFTDCPKKLSVGITKFRRNYSVLHFVSEWAASRLRRRSWTRTRRMQMWNCQHAWAERNYCNTATNSWKTYRPWWSGLSGDSARSSVTPRRECACCSGMFCLEVHIRNCYYTGCLKKEFVLYLVCLVTGP